MNLDKLITVFLSNCYDSDYTDPDVVINMDGLEKEQCKANPFSL
jgi:hypothetical protein